MLELPNATIKLFTKRLFKDADTGTETTRYTYYLQCENESGDSTVFEVNSKQDYTKFIDKTGTAHVTPYPQKEGTGFWLSLTGFNPDIT